MATGAKHTDNGRDNLLRSERLATRARLASTLGWVQPDAERSLLSHVEGICLGSRQLIECEYTRPGQLVALAPVFTEDHRFDLV